MDKTIIYEPHPVSSERRKALIDRGFIIIDAKFAPDGYVNPDKKKTPRKKVNANESDS